MDENIKTNSAIPSANMKQKQSPTFDPRDDYPDEYFDDYMYDDLYYDDICMSCQHWTGGICRHEHGICNYEPL